MSEVVTAKAFHHRFSVPTISKLKNRKLLTGKAELQKVSQGMYEVSFLLCSDLQIIISYEVSREIDSIIIKAILRSDHEEDNFTYEFHEHGKIQVRADWNCLNIYEIGPHIHFGKKPKYKINCKHRINLESFLIFIFSRHQYKHLEKFYGKALGRNAKIVGLEIV